MNILAVDDDPVFLEILNTSLISAGFAPATLAHSAEEALCILDGAETPFDCILLDIRMPGRDGIELCREIRGMGDYKNVPILMITVVAEREYVRRAIAAGADDYLTKPLDALELTTRLRLAANVIDQRRTIIETGRQLEALSRQIEDVSTIPIDAPIAIGGVSGVVDRLVQENFLLRLDAEARLACGALAFRLGGIVELHANVKPGDFLKAIQDVASSLAAYFDGTRALLAYHGQGAFVCVSRRNSPRFDTNELDTVSDRLAPVLESLTRQAGVPVTLEVGDTVALGMFHNGPVTDLLNRALGTVGLEARDQDSDTAAA